MISLHALCRTVHRQSYFRHTLMCQALHTSQAALYKTRWSDAETSAKKDVSRANRNQQSMGSASPHSFTVFSAGAARKRSAMMQHKAEEPAEMTCVPLKTPQASIPSVPLGSNEWGKLKKEFGRTNNFEDLMMSQIIKTHSDISVAKSLLNFAAKENGISYKLLLKYLVLCVKLNCIAEVNDVYDIMKDKFKSLDTGASSLFIKGFSQTDRWRESIAVLEMMKKTVIPSPRNYGDCIQGAINHREGKVAWDLYKEMLQNDLTPCEDTFQCLFNADRGLQDETFRNELNIILAYFRDHQIYPGESLMQSIKFWFESIPNENWKGKLSRVSDSGHCHVCNQQLESIQLKPEEYKTLKDSILDRVIKGRDIFRKTTPQELQEFQHFVKSRPPFDIVVDGLNVAHMNPKGIRSQTLLDVVSSLASGGKRVLVLGRKHMLQSSRSWMRQHMQLLHQRADCFFLDNVSEDDPFVLLASLSSGNQCCFITKDLLRDLRACLRDVQTQRLFFKWQRGHQLVIPFYSPRQKVCLQPILSYDTILQSTDSSWHIPYDEPGVERASYEVPKTWLCLHMSR